MTIAMAVLAMIVAANPFRAAAASPTEDRSAAAAVGALAVLGLTLMVAIAAGPLLDLLGVTDSSARIAAGVAVIAVGLKDLFARPPEADPGLSGWRAGLVPLAWPVVFSPSMALVALAAAAERGVGFAVAVALPSVALVTLAIWRPPRGGLRPAIAAVGALGAGVGTLVVLDGVYAI